MRCSARWSACIYAASGVSQFVVGLRGRPPGRASGAARGARARSPAAPCVASLVPGVGWLFPIVALMGVGNGVFHPADFAILNANVAPRRLGHAYSTHGIGGNLGYALAPVVSFALGAAFGWRVALAGMGVDRARRARRHGEPARATSSRIAPRTRISHTRQGQRGALPAAADPAVLRSISCSVTIGAVGLADVHPDRAESGVRRLAGARDLDAHRVSAGRRRRHPRRRISRRADRAPRPRRRRRDAARRRRAAGVVAIGAVPSPLLLPVFVLIGFALGATGPSRDLIVRAATPKGAAGRVYGFVYSGPRPGRHRSAPSWFGFMLDHGHRAARCSSCVAACSCVAIGTVIRVRARVVAAHRARPSAPERRSTEHGSRHRRQARAGLRGEQGAGARLRAGARATKACDVTIVARTEDVTCGAPPRRSAPSRARRCAGSRATSRRRRAARRRSRRARARHPDQQRRRTAARRFPRLGPRRRGSARSTPTC